MDGAVRDGAFREPSMLARIATTLLALALVAERAAGRSLPVRFLVLAVLGRAEAIARAFVAREIAADWPDAPCLEEPSAAHYGAVDAQFLALRLRMLATVLAALADACAGSTGEEPGGAPRLSALLPLLVPETLPVILVFRLPAACGRGPPPDTS